MKKITANKLVCMNDYEDGHPIRIELAYAQADNLLFGEVIYKDSAQFWLYEDLAETVLRAAQDVHAAYGYCMVLYDGLRTVEAQVKMLETQRVQDNPQWLQEPRLLSTAGAGGHPRGMAVDVSLETDGGELLDMGTNFDFLAEDSSPENNPAHREYKALSPDVIKNRNVLNNAILGASERLVNKEIIEMPIEVLPQEWWDFRAPREFYERFAPLSDDDLPEEMRMVCL